MALRIAKQTDVDWPEVWSVLEPVFRAGETYPLPLDMCESEARQYWIKNDGYNAVARNDAGDVIGVYYIRPDQGGPGDHICNAGYVIAEAARGRGHAVALCKQSQEQACAMGYRGMKFNLVVAVNAPAIHAWKHAGMEIIGAVPKAFRHPRLGFVDAFIMYRQLNC